MKPKDSPFLSQDKFVHIDSIIKRANNFLDKSNERESKVPADILAEWRTKRIVESISYDTIKSNPFVNAVKSSEDIFSFVPNRLNNNCFEKVSCSCGIRNKKNTTNSATCTDDPINSLLNSSTQTFSENPIKHDQSLITEFQTENIEIQTFEVKKINKTTQTDIDSKSVLNEPPLLTVSPNLTIISDLPEYINNEGVDFKSKQLTLLNQFEVTLNSSEKYKKDLDLQRLLEEWKIQEVSTN